jgi:hypothetical protein
VRIYRREGVASTWLIHLVAQTLEVYRLETGRWWLIDAYEADPVVRAELFDAVELSPPVLWER